MTLHERLKGDRTSHVVHGASHIGQNTQGPKRSLSVADSARWCRAHKVDVTVGCKGDALILSGCD